MSIVNGASIVQSAVDGDRGSVPPTDEPATQESQTATDYINSQLQLEADAREALPYTFDTCTQPLGSLRQPVFACLTCTPPPASAAQAFSPAGVCYSCSIACHGDHTLVEIFSKRNFVCDCGTTRFINAAPCTLRSDPTSGAKGVQSQNAADGNKYNQNFQNKFCGCEQEYDPHTERGTMFQCLGLGSVESGGCGEDWWHPECVLGLPRESHQKQRFKNGNETPLEEAEHDKVNNDDNANVGDDAGDVPFPPGFPGEDDFESFICYKCVNSNAWIKAYAGTAGFLPAIFKKAPTSDPYKKDDASHAILSEDSSQGALTAQQDVSRKRKASEELGAGPESSSKKAKEDPDTQESTNNSLQPSTTTEMPTQKHDSLPKPPEGTFSLFCKQDFREHFCHCPACYPQLLPHPQLVEEEETYEPPLSEDEQDDGAQRSAHSEGSRSLYDRGEAALNSMDRVRAIEGVMAYNHMRDKVKAFLKPYAESGQAVGAEDIKAYFEKLRGDEAAIKEAGSRTGATDEGDTEGDNRREQSGY